MLAFELTLRSPGLAPSHRREELAVRQDRGRLRRRVRHVRGEEGGRPVDWVVVYSLGV